MRFTVQIRQDPTAEDNSWCLLHSASKSTKCFLFCPPSCGLSWDFHDAVTSSGVIYRLSYNYWLFRYILICQLWFWLTDWSGCTDRAGFDRAGICLSCSAWKYKIVKGLFHHWKNKLLSEEIKVPRTLPEARKVAGSATFKQSKTVWNCVCQL